MLKLVQRGMALKTTRQELLVDNDGLGEPISLSTYYSSGSGFLTAIIIPEEDVLLPLPLFLLVWCFEGSELILNLRAFGVV